MFRSTDLYAANVAALLLICFLLFMLLFRRYLGAARKTPAPLNRIYKFLLVLALFFACAYFLFLRFFLVGSGGGPDGPSSCEFHCDNKSVIIHHSDVETTTPAARQHCNRTIVKGTDDATNLHVELIFECALLVLLSVCLFQSLLALEKMLIALLLCTVCLFALWFLALPILTMRQFHLWFHASTNDTTTPTRLLDQLDAYCGLASPSNDLRIFFSFLICFAFILITIHSRRSELVGRFDFIWKLEALGENVQMKRTHEQNRRVLENILPAHVATHFLSEMPSTRAELYSEGRENVCIIFVSLTEFNKFYTELDANNEGVECLRLLNEIIFDFDDLLDRPEFSCIEKIKTISTTYMAASGLTGATDDNAHVVAVAKFAIELLRMLEHINEHSFNNFKLRIGINVGPVVAGVIGTDKPHYDIWGNAVNVASRMDSSGIAGRIQVTEETKQILEREGFDFECRGEINVKGKGLMTTYLLKVPEADGEGMGVGVEIGTGAETEPRRISMNGGVH